MRDTFLLSRILRFLYVLSIPSLLLTGCFARSFVARAQNASSKPHSVTIQWAAAQPPAAGYFVYRSSGTDKPARLTGAKISGTEYTDRTVVAGHSYSYYVTTVDSKGVESKPSQNISATIPSP